MRPDKMEQKLVARMKNIHVGVATHAGGINKSGMKIVGVSFIVEELHTRMDETDNKTGKQVRCTKADDIPKICS